MMKCWIMFIKNFEFFTAGVVKKPSEKMFFC